MHPIVSLKDLQDMQIYDKRGICKKCKKSKLINKFQICEDCNKETLNVIFQQLNTEEGEV